MKLSTTFLGLLGSAVTVYSATDYATASQEDVLIRKVGEDCRNELTNNAIFNKCMNTIETIDRPTYDAMCETLFSEDCTKFFSDPLALLPNCQDDPIMQAHAEYIKETTPVYNKFTCEKLSDGKYCPVIENYISDGNVATLMDVGLNCEYSKCKDITLQKLELDLKYDQYIGELIFDQKTNEKLAKENYDKYFEQLTSSECISKTKTDEKVAANGTTNGTTNGKTDGKVSSGASSNSIKIFGSLLSSVLLYVLF